MAARKKKAAAPTEAAPKKSPVAVLKRTLFVRGHGHLKAGTVLTEAQKAAIEAAISKNHKSGDKPTLESLCE